MRNRAEPIPADRVAGVAAGPASADLGFLAGGGEAGAMMRAHDWSATPLGPPEGWPAALRVAVGLILASPEPMYLAWGRDLLFLFNDAYRPVLGPRLPRAMGAPLPELWSDIWEQVRPIAERALAGEPSRFEDLPLTMARRGVEERIWWSFSISPLRDERGAVAGLVCVTNETTERVRSVTALRESEARFRNMADHAPVMMWLTDPAGRCTYLNRRWYEFTGQNDDEAEGHGWLDATHADDRARAEETFLAANAAREAFRLEYRLRRSDGVHRWVIDAASPRFGAGGEYLGHVGSVIDIDERREAELALRELNADLERQVVERSLERGRTWQVSPDLLAVLDVGGRLERTNPAWRAVLGWSEAELALTSLFALIHPDDLERTRAGFGRLKADRPLLRFENRCRGRDGRYRWLSWTAVPEDGKLYYSARDVTADREQAAALTARTAERDRLWRNSRDLLAVVDAGGVFRAANPAWTAILGWAAEEVVGCHHLELIHPDDHPSSRDALALATREELPTYENRYRHKDGGYRWISWVAAPEDELIYASGRHVTAEREQAEALRRVEERLRQSQKMEAVGQLTGGIAHDFNNLLQGVTGGLELLQRRLDQGRLDELPRYAAAAAASARRAATLVQRLLAFSRRQPLDPRPVDVNRLVASMEELLRRTLGPAIAQEAVLSGGLWPTLCDPNQLESAILNLAINARDAMPDGGRLTVETQNAHLDEAYVRSQGGEVRPGQYVAVSVTDTGTGMAPDVAARAFDPFFTTKPVGQGTGLGLSSLYGFARQSGGHARIYSEVGRGTTVRLYLPRHRGGGGGAAGAADEPPGATPAAGRGDIARSGESVLVVEDEAVVRMLVAEVLDDLGYAALEAADGPAGLAILRSDARVDLLVTDVGLPGLGGRELAEAARGLRPGLKVLFVTGYAHNAALGGGALPPGAAMVSKPFAVDDLARTIRAMIEGD